MQDGMIELPAKQLLEVINGTPSYSPLAKAIRRGHYLSQIIHHTARSAGQHGKTLITNHLLDGLVEQDIQLRSASEDLHRDLVDIEARAGLPLLRLDLFTI